MGIPTDEIELDDGCPLCFPAFETPATVWVNFTGIKAGGSWSESDGKCPNGVYELPRTEPCKWRKVIGDITIQLNFDISHSLLYLRRTGYGYIFYDNFFNPCVWYYENSITSPFGKEFYSGRASVVFTAPVIGPSVQKAMSKLNIPPDSKTFAEVFPASDSVNCYRIARKKDKTLINILFDYS